MKKHRAPQLEVKWDQPEPFALVVQTTTDGAAAEQREAQRQEQILEQEKRQPQLL